MSGTPSATERRRVTVDSAEPRWSRASGWVVATPFRIGWALLVVTCVAVRAVTSSQWSWYADDWKYMVDASETSLPGYVLQNYNDHMMPAQFLIQWVLTETAPLARAPAVVLTCVFAAGALVAWGLALRELFAERVQVLAGLTIIGLAPVMTTIGVWWAAAMQFFTMQMFMGLCVWQAARVVASGGARRHVLGLVGFFVLGLVFWQKALLILVPVAFVFLFVPPGSLRARLAGAVRPVGVLAAISAGYLVLYLLNSDDSTGGSSAEETVSGRSVGEVARFLWRGTIDTALPALVGGPYGDVENEAYFVNDAPALQTAVVLVLALLVAAAALWFRRRAGVAMGMVATYLILTWGLVLFNDRYDFAGVSLARDPRYFADALPVVVLGLLFLITPLRGEGPAALRRPLTPASRTRLRLLAAHATTATVVVSLVGTLRMWEGAEDHSPKPWVDNVVADARALGPATLYDASPPANVIEFIFHPEYARLSRLLAPLELPLRFNEPTERFVTTDAQGNLFEAIVQSANSDLPGRDDLCPHPVDPGAPTPIPLAGELFDFGWAAEVSYFAEQPGRVRFETDETTVEAETAASTPGSVNTVQFVVTGEVTSFSAEVLDGARVCVSEVRIGNVEPSLVRAGR